MSERQLRSYDRIAIVTGIAMLVIIAAFSIYTAHRMQTQLENQRIMLCGLKQYEDFSVGPETSDKARYECALGEIEGIFAD